MKTRIPVAVAACLLSLSTLTAQELKDTTWSSYGVSFRAPSDITVEDDSEEGYIVSNDTYYITVQLLDGEGFKRNELGDELKNIANDDQVSDQSALQSFETPQFYGAQIEGNCEGEACLYSYLLSKDDSCGFYVSILYKQKGDTVPETILKSFKLED